MIAEASMRTTIALATTLLVLGNPLVGGAQSVPAGTSGTELASPASAEGVLAAAVRHQALRLAVALESAAIVDPATPSRTGGWITRHPALFGALVGAGAGAVAAGTMNNELFCSGGDEDCLFHGDGRVMLGAGIGAGTGALVGALVGIGDKN
jgi:hypothetical protein